MATTRYIDIKVRSKGAEKDVNNLDKSMKKLGADTDKTSKSFGALSKVASAIAAALSVQQLVKYADAYTNIQNQIRQTTNSTAQLTQRTSDLLAVANRSRTEFGATAELYTQLNLSTENLNLSTSELLRLTETIGKSFAVSGKSAAESSGAIRQLGQAFSSGALRGDEFNSIAEGAPEIMRALQRSLGKTQGELREFAATGGITAEILVTALGKAAEVIDAKMTKATKTFGQSMQEANNNMIDFIGSSTTVQNVIGGAGGALVTASQNIDLIAKSAAILAAVFAARLIPSILTYSAGIIANTQAQLLNGTVATRTANIYGVVAVAQARATVTTNALTLASRALAASMAFLGGPLGIVLIAAAALVTFNDEIFNTGEKARLSSEEVDEFSASLAKLTTRASKSKLLGEINNEMQEVRNRIALANDSLSKLEKFSDSPFKAQGINQLKSRITELNNELDLLSEKQGLIATPIDASGFTDRGEISFRTRPKESPSSSPTSNAFLDKLKQETEALFIEQELRRQVQEGFLSQEDADKSARFLINQSAEQSRFNAELIKLGTNEEAKAELQALFNEQQLLTKIAFEESLTGIEQEGSEKRLEQTAQEIELKRLARDNEISNAQSGASAALSLIKAFGIKSFKAQKVFAIADSIVNITAGVAHALNNPYPANLGFAAQVAAQGVGLIATLKSANPNSSSGVASIGGSPGLSSNQSTSPSSQSAPDLTSTIENTAITQLTNELRNRDPDEPLTVDFTRRIVAAITYNQSSGVI